MKKMKKFLALALSASMVMGMTLTSMAAEPEVSVDAPIYSYDITNIVVPTTFAVAFNPDGLTVDMDGDKDTSADQITSQIVSKSYGIINKSTKDKVITVTLNVEDLNGDKIEFVENASDITTASADAYAVNLTLIPANATEVKVGSTPDSADLTTTGADLASVTMAAATTTKTLVAGENEVDFLLSKADYTGTIVLDTATNNNVADDFTLTGLAAAGKGITAFTFGGSMNAKADWTKLTKGIKITAVYSNENAPDGATPETGTGALFVNPNPTFRAGDGVGVIKYKRGEGAMDALSTITKIEMEWGGKEYDGYHSGGKFWAAAADKDGQITLAAAFVKSVANAYPDDITRPATVTYETMDGQTKTATVNVRIKEYTGVTFTAGSAVGSINYVIGTGNDALASITKIEMEWNGTAYDGYNSGGKFWAAATDSDGLITLAAAYIKNSADAYTSDATRPATITYVTSSGETKTATVNVKIR